MGHREVLERQAGRHLVVEDPVDDARQRHEQDDAERLAMYEKMVVRTLFGNINAARNSA